MNTATILILGGLALAVALIVIGQRGLDRSGRGKPTIGVQGQHDSASAAGVAVASDGGCAGGDGSGAC